MALELTDRLSALRDYMRAQGVQGIVVPHEDEYHNEFLPPHAERLAWLTGFTGSWGVAIVLGEEAAVFVDGRYVIQVGHQVNLDQWQTYNVADLKPEAWLAEKVGKGDRIGFDPWLHTPSFKERWGKEIDRKGAELVPLAANPVDALWEGRPDRAGAPAMAHPVELAGENSAMKRERIGERVREAGADAALITALDSLAWLFNIRGTEVPFTPVVEARAILHGNGHAILFIDEAKVTPALEEHLGPQVAIRPLADLEPSIEELAAGGIKLLADPMVTPLALTHFVEEAGGEIVRGDDPCTLPKAEKNAAEIEGMRRAHKRDGVALVRFLAWLDQQMAGDGTDELTVMAELYRLRSEGEHFMGLSFDTISGSGPNGAIIHYRATEATNRALQRGDLLLLDSGGQYLDGTTDVTRTIALGEPGPEERDRFTRVLKGHIAIGRARFPVGTTGSHLDSLARQALWDAGLDYDHGTGHGVGSYLNVHEGPQRISRRGGDVALQPGMVISNEPGFYKAGEYGIRIESLVTVRDGPEGEAGRKFLSFETLTLAPLDRRLIAAGSLTDDERQWVDDYHARVRAEIAPHLDGATRRWLEEATAPL